MKKGFLVLPMLLLVIASVFATGGVARDVNIFSVGTTTPASGTYWADGRQSVDFNIHAEDANGNLTSADINCNMAISIAAGDFNWAVAADDGNTNWFLRGGSFCADNNDFNDAAGGNLCTFTFSLSDDARHHVGDGNYVIDLNCYTMDGNAGGASPGAYTGDSNIGIASSSFYIDNNAPPFPKSFVIEQLTQTSVRLHWDANSSHGDPRHWAKFVFWRSQTEFTDCNAAGVKNDSNSSTAALRSKDITDLNKGELYYFCVTVMDAAGNQSRTTSRIQSLTLREDTIAPGIIPGGVEVTKTTTGGTTGGTAAGIEKAKEVLLQPVQIGTVAVPLGVLLLVGGFVYYQYFYKKKK